MKKYFKYVLTACAVLAFAACTETEDPPGGGGGGDDNTENNGGGAGGGEAGGEEQEPGVRPNWASMIFRNGWVTDYDGNRLTWESGRVTRIEGNMGKATLEYDGDAVVMRSVFYDGSGTVYDMKRVDCGVHRIEKHDHDGVVVYKVVYDGDGCMREFVSDAGTADEEVTRLTWENGNVVQVNTTWHGGSSVCDIQYTDEPNRAGLMLYDTQLWTDTGTDLGEVLYFCGLLGRPTQNLVKSSTATEYVDGEVYRFSSTSNYVMDFRGRPTQVRLQETEEGYGTGTNVIDIDWADI